MIVVKLYGGLGNQLFQYAAARCLAHKLGVELFLDTSWFSLKIKRATPRKFELYNYLIYGKLPSLILEKELLLYNNRILKYLPFPRRLTRVNEKYYHYDPAFLDLGNNTYLNGYWQSNKYFEDCRLMLIKELTPKQSILKVNEEIQNSIVSNPASVAVHIRRTDYLTNQLYNVCSLEYYQKAADKILEYIKSPTFYVFSDDPEYVIKNVKFNSPTVYVIQEKDTHSSCEDLRLMSLCSNQIIANSSFSWWGAWLNQNPEKLVIAPSQWFSDKTINTNDFYPPKWIKI